MPNASVGFVKADKILHGKLGTDKALPMSVSGCQEFQFIKGQNGPYRP